MIFSDIFKIVFLCFITVTLRAQVDSISFISPVDHPERVSGNFMELRSNHFHAGLDLKSSEGKVGDNIRAVADGYISRVKVQAGSYGKVLYIDHPNGLTTVYAHLRNFYPELEQWVKELQYAKKSFELDIYLTDTIFPVRQGQLIGNMGNTGRSFGPHLHFEVRDTRTEKPLNPESFGFGPDDSIAPVIENLVVYYFDDNARQTDQFTRYLTKKSGNYTLYTRTLALRESHVAFGIQAFDRIDGSYNKNGINSYELFLDDSLMISWRADNYAFYEAKKINGFIDYAKYRDNGQKIYRLHSPKCSSLNAIKGSGIIERRADSPSNVRITVSDIAGNKSTLEFDIEFESTESIKDKMSFTCDSLYEIQSDEFKLRFEKHSFFFPLPSKSIRPLSLEIMGQNCEGIKVFEPELALAEYYSISSAIPDTNPQKWCFVMKDKRGRWVNFGAYVKDSNLYTELDQCGEVYLYKDDLAPVIELVYLDNNKKQPWIFRISDNLIPDGKTPDLYYEAYANDQWLCFEYDLKSNQLIFDDFEMLPEEDFVFSLKVRDDQGNETLFTREIPKG